MHPKNPINKKASNKFTKKKVCCQNNFIQSHENYIKNKSKKNNK